MRFPVSRVNKGLILFLLLIAGIGAAGYGKVTEEPRREDGCLQSGPEWNIVVLVDGSDPIADTQLSELRRWLRQLAKDSGSNKKLWVFVFGGGGETRKLPPTAAEDLLEIIMRRYERASTILTSNRPIEDWGKILGDTAAVTAMLDRLLHHAHILKCGPRSWRSKEKTALHTRQTES